MVKKRCPVCGQIFPELARYCDQDGAQLIPAERHANGRRPGFRRAGIAALVLLLACGVTLPWLAHRYLRWKVDVVLEEVRFPGPTVTDPEAGDSSRPRDLVDGLLSLIEPILRDPTLALRLRVRNDSPLSATLMSARYAVEIGEQEVATGVWVPEPGPRTVAAGEELPVDLVLRPKPSQELNSEMLRAQGPSVRVHGDLTIEVLGITFTLPFEVRQVRVDLSPSADDEPPPAPATQPEEDRSPKRWT